MGKGEKGEIGETVHPNRMATALSQIGGGWILMQRIDAPRVLGAVLVTLVLLGGAQMAGAYDGRSPSVLDPEFGGRNVSMPGIIRSTSPDGLLKDARRAAGRFNPFISPVLPDGIVIAPIPAHPRSEDRHSTSAAVKAKVSGQAHDDDTPAQPQADPEPSFTVLGIIRTGDSSLALVDEDGVPEEVGPGQELPSRWHVIGITADSISVSSHGKIVRIPVSLPSVH